jgi:transposase-like protein
MKHATRRYTTNKVTPMPPVRCPHCQSEHDPKRLAVNHTYPNGRRRHFCRTCGQPFMSIVPPCVTSARPVPMQPF